jgi:2-oxoacid:acceptor oxidoreductase delta subunit (pyruvate/2-ketoisovalerate family)
MNDCRHFKFEGPWSDASDELLCLDTGSWRTTRPVMDMERCIFCGFCALFCPTGCMKITDDRFEPDLAFCKGCGICANECPGKAITMSPEGDWK